VIITEQEAQGMPLLPMEVGEEVRIVIPQIPIMPGALVSPVLLQSLNTYFDMLTSKRIPINIPPGVNKDDNAYTALSWSDADKIRFYRYFPQKIGGWAQIDFDNSATIEGVPRSLFSYIDNTGFEHLLIGTNYGLYSYESGDLFNITPLIADTTAIANSLSTNYNTLSNNPIITSIGSNVVTIVISPFAATTFRAGDIIKLSGITGNPGGILNANLNGVVQINNVLPSAILINAANNVTATSTATSGGNAVVLSTRVISVAQTANGFSNGERVQIAAATAFGGFTIGELNIQTMIRNVSTNAYDYYMVNATTWATSSISAGGGSDTTVQGQISAGICQMSTPEGYGGGDFGQDIYGQGYPFGTGFEYPQIWFFALFNNTVIMTPGNQGAIYVWNGDVTTAPILLSAVDGAANVPTAVNYIFVAQNQVVALGVDGAPNSIATSDTDNPAVWTIDATTNAFSGQVADSEPFIAHGYVKDQYLLFTQNSVSLMYYVGKPNLWIVTTLLPSDGAISPKSILSFNDVVTWQGQLNFYIYNGSIVSTIPNNNLKEWFLSNINPAAFYHSFVHKSAEFNETWFFSPFGNSIECTNYIIWNWEEGHWTNGTLTRTASETPPNLNRPQYMATGSCDGSIPTALYQHEIPGDYSDNGGNMTGSLSSNSAMIGEGDYMQQIYRLIPSNVLLPYGTQPTGNLLYSTTILTKEYDGQPNERSFGAYDIYDTTPKVETRINGRQRQYVINFSNTFGFRIEKFFEELKPTTVR
jgi:hypothetical protein